MLIDPIGLDRDDEKHPDGITRFPFKSGKSLIWIAACTDTFSTGTLVSSAVNPRSSFASAELSKQKKYESLSDRFIFTPIVVETSGVLGPLSIRFLRDVGRMAVRERHEPKEGE